jgi:RNA polymerase sigma-70 factor, ECF subfamily
MSAEQTHAVEDAEPHRGRLFGLAYRMLGSVADAEDVVQETFLRWARADRETIDNPAGWLTTVCSRLCLDRLRSARRQREEYVGPWLPEPLITEGTDASATVLEHESLTLAFLVVLDTLSPPERVAFLLHDVFGHPHDAIARMLGRSPAAVRQLASRARRRVRDARVPAPVPRGEGEALVDAFVTATAGGDLDRLLELLAPDVEMTSDGGGAVAAARRPVTGAQAVARFLLGLGRRADDSYALRSTRVNGAPGLVILRDGRPDSVFALTAADGRVTQIHVVRNPDKLRGVDARP